METCLYLEEFIEKVFCYLTSSREYRKTYGLFRKHSAKLDQFGEVSFPLSINCWKKYIQDFDQTNSSTVNTILEYNTEIQPFDPENLLKQSKNEKWPLLISKCLIVDQYLQIYFDKYSTFNKVLDNILTQKENYGSYNKSNFSNISITCENSNCDKSNLTLSQLRVIILYKIANNFISFNNCDMKKEKNISKIVHFASKINENLKHQTLFCGNVIVLKGGVKTNKINSEEFYRKRTTDMQLMAQHKYGLRVTSEPGWDNFFKHLGDAAVNIDLVFNKPSRNITLNFDNHTLSQSKGAPFILYNCARLAALFKKFDSQVVANIYPPLPQIQQIDFKLLNQPEEWELLYVYLLQFPYIVKNCIEKIAELKFNPQYLCSFLSEMCALFSIYYRRIRILTESRSHMIPVLHARLYLLRGIEIVLHNGLNLLNIAPVKQM